MGRAGKLGVALMAMSAGCSIAPRDFHGVNDAAPLVRARSIGLSRELPDTLVIPALIDHLSDSDRVVRLAASEELRVRTGQDFGFNAWAEPPDREKAIERWKEWHVARQVTGMDLPPLPD